MASRHKGQTEEQALMANIERNRQFITEHSLKIPDPAQISRELRTRLSANPLKLTSMALMAGIAATAFLRNSSGKSTRTNGKLKRIWMLANWLLHQADKPEKSNFDATPPFGEQLVSTIREIFK